MPGHVRLLALVLWVALASVCGGAPPEVESRDLTLTWEDNILRIHGERLPGNVVEVLYVEAYCRPNSHTTDWGKHTVIDHETKLVSASDDGKWLKLKCVLEDGVIVEHTITAAADGVDFQLVVRNPTERVSQAHWAQPCIRVGEFTGLGDPDDPSTYDYLKRSFIFLDGKLARLPTEDWATKARYTPGQVWRAPGVSPRDVNPRPLNPRVPSNGLIGCFSGDDTLILASVWQPYQELFQGVITCLHSDFRIGGLKPGETKTIEGKIYIVPNDVPRLLERYREDFPEQAGVGS